MKKATKQLVTLILSLVLTASCLLLAGCGNSSDGDSGTQGNSDTQQQQQQQTDADTSENDAPETDDTAAGGDDGDVSSFAFAGEYTVVDGDITYLLKVLANEDYEMAVTRQYDGYTATKYYAGPLKDINGAHMATMPVFLSDFYYSGDAAPDDDAEIYDQMNAVYQATRGETEESRFFYITLDKDTMSFTCDEGQETKLDPTEGYWEAADFDAE